MQCRSYIRQDRSRFYFLEREVADPQQQVVQAVFRPYFVLVVEVLQLCFESSNRACIEQFTQFGIAEQLPELRLIDRQRLGASFRQRRIACRRRRW